MSERRVEILLAAGRRAAQSDSPYVDAHYLAPGELDVLADDALIFLRGRPGKASQTHGWTRVAASQAGLMPYWSSLTDWRTDEEKKPFRPLRRDVYDRLEERGEIVKPPGQGKLVGGSPADISPSVTKRIGEVIDAVVEATDVGPDEYRELVSGPDPRGALVAFLSSPTTSTTTKALHKRGRLELSLEDAALDWDEIPAEARKAASERLAYWRSE